MTPEENHLLQSKELFLDAQHLFVIGEHLVKKLGNVM